MKLPGRWSLITGAAAGIGRATARRMAHGGTHLVLCDKAHGAVDEFANELRRDYPELEILSYGLDVTDEGQVDSFADYVLDHSPGIDILVNNAGILRTGRFFDNKLEDWDALYNVHLRATVHMIFRFVPTMIEKGEGIVVNVASSSGKVGYSLLPAYSSMKFAVIGLSQALRADLYDQGIRVAYVCPGLVRTEIARSAGLSPEKERETTALLERHGIAPEKVANAVYGLALSGAASADVGLDAKLISLASRLIPSAASRMLTRAGRRVK